jgi:hypothetical protein
MKTMLRMFTHVLKKTQTFVFIIKRMGWKLVENAIIIDVNFGTNGNKE